ncbi:MAG: alpha/beta fold hydrolase [Candidatus Rokuibacteriota bacterium]
MGEPDRQTLDAEWLLGLRRSWKMLERAVHHHAVRIGLTPRNEVYRRKKARLYRYIGTPRHPTPILLVPNLAMTRPDIFDLQPGASLVEFLVGQGFDFYLLDWGVFGEEDRDLTIDECVEETLPRAIAQVLATSGAPALSALGYCMGATLIACHLGLRPASPVRRLVSLAGPVDFSRGGLFTQRLDRRYFDADRVTDTLGMVPPEFFQLVFGLLRPTTNLSVLLNLWWRSEDDAYVERSQAMSHWANTYSAMPGEFFRKWVKELYQENRLVRGEFRLRGQAVDLGRIRCPVLAVVGAADNIVPPAAALALIEHVGSKVKESAELPGGHASLFAGGEASARLWPALAQWLADGGRPDGQGQARDKDED